MNLRAFVSGSAVVLMGWLVVSFFHRNSPQRYQQNLVSETTPEPSARPTPATADAALVSAVSPSP